MAAVVFGRLPQRFLGHCVLDLAGHFFLGHCYMVGLLSGCLGLGSIYTKGRFTPLRYTQEARGLWVAGQDTRSHGYKRGGCLVFVVLRF
jgi:hypothetical protein